jgi:hypothetical protein
MENNVAAVISSHWNFTVRSGAIDPRVMNVIPKSSIPAQAAANTILLLYIFIF